MPAIECTLETKNVERQSTLVCPARSFISAAQPLTSAAIFRWQVSVMDPFRVITQVIFALEFFGAALVRALEHLVSRPRMLGLVMSLQVCMAVGFVIAVVC